MLYTVYKTTNKINGKYYIGSHRTHNPNDGYLGSGVALRRAIEKYEKENFSKEVLFVFDNPEEMFAKEKELVEIGEHSYNLMEGGKGGFDHIDNTGDNNCMRNPEVVKRFVESAKSNGSYHTKNAKAAQLQNLKKAVEANIGRERTEEWKSGASARAKNQWELNKEKLRDALASWFVVTDPNGNVYETNRLEEFCKDKELPYTSLWKTTVTGKTPNRGKAKGWLCEKKLTHSAPNA